MEQYFKIKERGSTVKTEFTAGMTTFFAMVYILMINANMFADPFGDGKKIKGSSWVVAGLFIAMLLLTH